MLELQSSEEVHFHDLAFAFVVAGQPLEGLIQLDQINRSFFEGRQDVVAPLIAPG